MKRPHVPIRAAPPAASQAAHSPAIEPVELKKRRHISQACNSCRKRKIRCDGQRPTCINCANQTVRCTYRDDLTLSAESRKVVVDIFRMLNSLPAAQAINLISGLSTEPNAYDMLLTLKDEATKFDTASFDSGDRPPSFATQYPAAFPAALRSNLAEPQEQSQPSVDSPSKQAPSDTTRHSAHLAQPHEHPPPPRASSSRGQPVPSALCDPRLEDLDISEWTTVEVDNTIAARCISLYLETDHPLLGHFDPDLFVSHLTSGKTEYCSSLLVNALLYWASQLYSSIDAHTDKLTGQFGAEAERLWRQEHNTGRDSLTSLAAVEFLGLGYLGQGRDHAILAYVAEASAMGVRMGLFGTHPHDGGIEEAERIEHLSEPARARTHASWGVFNWLTLMSLFYRQPGLFCPKHPPRVAIPALMAPEPSVEQQPPTRASQRYMGLTFPHLCRFWHIMHEVSTVYHDSDKNPWGSGASLAFAEYKFRELLAWSNRLPSRLSSGPTHPHHVQILHLWFHAAILDVFRPCMQIPHQQQWRLRTFSEPVTPKTICDASVTQLKRLVTDYRQQHSSSTHNTILWHTALIYMTNAILNDESEPSNWYADLLICLYGYESLGKSWRITTGIAKSLLSLAMRKRGLSGRTAQLILRDLEKNKHGPSRDNIRATFMADLDMSISDPESATVEELARQFDTDMLLTEYTNVMDEDTKALES